MIDQHTHTIFSPDASKDATFENYIASLNEKKLTSITFTDHCDFDCPTPLFHTIPDFYDFKRRLDEAQLNTSTLLQFGVELGYQPHIVGAMKQLVESHPFDAVLLSLHYVDGLDPYDGSFFKGRSLNEGYQRYFEEVLDAITAFDEFQILAHLDYIFRYSLKKTDAVDITLFYPILDAIFEVLIKRQKVLELNTSPWRKDYQNTRPNLGLIQRYYEKGGRLISLGSDAHQPSDVGADFDKAIGFLKTVGLTSLAWVKEKKIEEIYF